MAEDRLSCVYLFACHKQRGIMINKIEAERLTACAFARLTTLLEGFGNTLNQQHGDALYALVDSMTKMASGDMQGRYAFGMGTGLGKTTAIIAWLAAVEELKVEGISIAVAASQVEALCRLSRAFQDAGISEEKIGLLHSKPFNKEKAQFDSDYASLPSTDHNERRPYLLVTQQRIRSGELKEFHFYNKRSRDLLVWDESLLVSNHWGGRRRTSGSSAPTAAGCAGSTELFGVHQRAELGELLAAQLVALAALDPREQVAHERRQLQRVERLRDVVDAPDVEPPRPVPELRPCGEEDDRDLARALVLEELLGDPPAVEPRHHHVEEDDVRPPLARLVEPARAVGRLEHLHALGLEVDPAEEPDRRLVVDHEHPRHVCSLSP